MHNWLFSAIFPRLGTRIKRYTFQDFFVEFFVLDRTDGADLWIAASKFSFWIQDGVNVKSRSLRLARKLS